MNKCYIILTIFTSIATYTSKTDLNKVYGRNHKSYDPSYDIKEMYRVRLVNLIKKERCYNNDNALAGELTRFLNLYPIYNNPQQKFNCNYTLCQYLEKYEKKHCWPALREISLLTQSQNLPTHPTSSNSSGESLSESLISPSNNPQQRSLSNSPINVLENFYNSSQARSAEESPENSLRKSANVSPYSNTSPTKERLSLHGCGKTPISCAFTCNHN